MAIPPPPTNEEPLPPLLTPGGERKGFLAWVDRILLPLPGATIERGSVIVILALGVIDFSLDPDFLFSVFYLLPIGAASWYGKSRAGYFACALAAGVWLMADLLGRTDTLPFQVAAWNLGVGLATFLVVATLIIRLHDSLEAQRRLALLDPLTGLDNARAFFLRLGEEIERALRYGRVFTLAYLDLDRFKEVNDTLGHAEGDDVLRTVAGTMIRTMRGTDVTARLGGDEFGILLPETPYGQAEGALAKLRTEVLQAMGEGDWPVTISVGAVTFEAPVSTADDAIRLADRLMYEAKEAGGNGIRHFLWTGQEADG